MKKINSSYQAFIILFFSAFILYGCMSVPDSPTPRFYMLRAVTADAVSQKFSFPAHIIIGLGPVKIPGYINRPQIVTLGKDKTLNFAQFDRWGESLDLALERVISEDLINLLPAGTVIEMFPWNLAVTVRYQIIVGIVKLESQLDKDLSITAQWSIIDQLKREVVLTKRSEIRRPIEPHNYYGLAETLSAACASLSSEIAQGLSSLDNNPATNIQEK